MRQPANFCNQQRKLAIRFLATLLPPAERDEIVADIDAEWEHRAEHSGRAAAAMWLWTQVLRSTPSLVLRSLSRGATGFDPQANVMNPGGPRMERLVVDIRYSARRMRTRPAYTALAVITLAIGIGGLAAVSGIVRPLLVSPLPFPGSEQLALFWRSGDWRGREVTALRDTWTSSGFANVVAYRQADMTLERDGEPARLIPGISATTELFPVLGVSPFIGRGFIRGEDTPGSAPVVVISHALWKQLGGDGSLVGKTLKLDGVSRMVIGVMPPGFWFPDPSVGIWTADSLAATGGVGFYTLVGRIAPEHRVENMRTSIDHVTKLLGSRFTYDPAWDMTKNAELTPLRDSMVGQMRPMLFATAAGMVVILLIACANVGALVLGQIERRSTELSVRAALGADRRRIATQITVELLLLGALAGVVASGFAFAGFGLLRESLPLGVWRDQASLDWTVFAAAFAIAMVCSFGIALLPVFSLVRGDPASVIAGTRTGGVLRRGGLQSPLIVTEVALAVLLSCGAGLVARSVKSLYDVQPGVETRGVAVLDVALPSGTRTAERRRVMAEMVQTLAGMPGVRTVGMTQRLPLRGRGWTMGLIIPGAPADAPSPNFRMVSRDYFAALGIPVVRGRGFLSTDAGADSISSIVVNRTLAKLYYPSIDPVGQIMTHGGFGKPERIVGVVGDVAEATLTAKLPPVRYYLSDQAGFVPGAQTIVMRIERDADAPQILADARRLIAKTAPSVAVQESTTMSRVLDLAIGPARDLMSLLSLLTALSLTLGAVGIYGVISQFVSRRNREWSIRVALGLAPARVVSLVVRHALTLVGLGVIAGVATALALTRFLSAFLFGITPRDPVTVGAASILLMLVGIVAALVPALRASRSDPALALREE